MSLNRVASLETFLSAGHPAEEGGCPAVRRPRRDSASSYAASERARKISFNPLPESWDPARTRDDDAPNPAVGAFEVPEWKRILQIAVTVVYCLFSAGIVFGYAAIKPVLKREGAYQEVCRGDDTCVEIRLNLMFTAAAVATNVAALPVGAILDHFGPRVSGCLGALFLALGSVVMAYARRLPFDGFLLGYLLLALGGPFTYISSFQLSNAFPRRSGLILALMTGAFDASSALFLGYRVVFERSGGAFGHDRFFLAYLVVPAAIVAAQFAVLPAQSYKTVGELIQDVEDADAGLEGLGGDSDSDGDDDDETVVDDQVDEATALLREEQRSYRAAVAHEVESLLGTAPQADKQARREERRQGRSGVWGVLHHASRAQQLRSAWFWLICLFTVVQMTRINYFVATIRPQYAALLGSADRAAVVNGVFDVALPLGGILSIPFIGGVLDHFSTVTVLAVLVAVAAAIGALGVLPFEWAAYANVALFVLYRPFYYTAVSDYSAKVFGFRNFGTVYGAVICLAGLVNFVQSGLDYLFHTTFGGDPVPVNLILLSLGLAIGLPLVAFVAYNVRLRESKVRARDAARRTRA